MASFTKTHLHSVDYIRAIASLSVAVYHLGGKTLPVLNYGWLGVSMFFTLSGFIICWSIPPEYEIKFSGTFLLKRLVRIEPPYLISIGVLLLIHTLALGRTIDWPNAALHLGHLNNFVEKPYLNPVYWTLGIEFQFYLLIAVLFPVLIKNSGSFFICLLSVIPVLFTFKAQLIFGVFPLFGLGILYYLFLKKHVTLLNFTITGIFVIVCAIASLGHLESCAGVFSLLLIASNLKHHIIINFLSKISFSLYLVHDIVGSRLVYFLGNILPKTVYFKGGIFVFGLIISILIAWIFYLFIERPFFLRSKSIKYN